MSRTKNENGFVSLMKETFENNANLFTGFAVALILLTGVSIVDNREHWWFAAVATFAFFLVFFLFMNARVVIKSSITIIMTMFLSVFGFQLGASFDPYGSGGLLWMMQTFFSFFVMLSIGYAFRSGRSKWGVAGVSILLNFAIVVAASPLGMWIACSLGAFLSIAIFFLLYRVTGNMRIKEENFPKNVYSQYSEKIVEAAEKNGWNATAIPEKNDSGSILIWKDKAFILRPVDLSAPLGVGGKKKKEFMAYEGHNIRPWLLKIVFKKTPFWKARNADIMTVLLDVRNKNGVQPRTIGVDIPDTRGKLAVGILPAKNLDRALSVFEEEYGDFVIPLKEKQRQAISRIGVLEDSKKVEEKLEESPEEKNDSTKL